MSDVTIFFTKPGRITRYEPKSKMLSEINFSDLRIGDKLISATGKNGKITKLIPEDDGSIEIKWLGMECPSIVYHNQSNHVEYKGR